MSSVQKDKIVQIVLDAGNDTIYGLSESGSLYAIVMANVPGGMHWDIMVDSPSLEV